MENNKYKMFKNFMMNELQISKEDIKEWIRESIKEECKNIVEQAYGKFDINVFLKKEITDILSDKNWYSYKTLKDEIYKELAKQVFAKYDVNLIVKENQK